MRCLGACRSHFGPSGLHLTHGAAARRTRVRHVPLIVRLALLARARSGRRAPIGEALRLLPRLDDRVRAYTHNGAPLYSSFAIRHMLCTLARRRLRPQVRRATDGYRYREYSHGRTPGSNTEPIPRRGRAGQASVTGLRSYGIAGGIRPLEVQAEAGPAAIGAQRSVNGTHGAVEEHLFDPHMVVEVLDRGEVADGAAGGDV